MPAWATVCDQPPATLVRLGERLHGTSYRIVRWIGEGGMGVVYEAEHIELGRRVALKILRPEFSGDQQAADRFASEARAVCRVGSGFVVQVYDFARLPDGRAVFTMELLGRRTLRSECDQGVFEVARAIGLLRQVCKALAAAHDAGIIHRDVKPDNIAILDGEGKRESIRLLDFGIHAIVDNKEGTADVRPAGTPSYVAPEAVVGVPVGVAADLYSLGCVAYEMLAGRLPFVYELESQQLLAHLDEVPPPLAQVAPHVPPALAAVIDRCLVKEPSERWADARDLEAAVCEAQIASGLQTDWDDLPLPEVDADRRDLLLRGMPDPLVAVSSRRGRQAAVFVFALLIGFVALSWPRADPGHLEAVEDLVASARFAAARAYFVYPPPEQPDLATAYRLVLVLEEKDAPGPERADALRVEFAETLARLGDRYWDEPGGVPFAIDYYAEAIVFVPGHERAAERAALTPGQLAAMRHKAATLEYSELELIAAEPLIALAEPDLELRNKALQALRARPRPRATSIGASLDALARGADLPDVPDVRDSRAARRAGRATERRDRPAVVGSESSGGDSPAAGVVATDEPKAPAPENREESRRITKRARAALSGGRYGEARGLFEAALSHDPRSASAHAGLAALHFERAQYTAAAKRGRRAVRLAPKNAAYRMTLGHAYYKTFHYRQALDEYAEAQRLGHGDAARAMGKVRAKLAARGD